MCSKIVLEAKNISYIKYLPYGVGSCVVLRCCQLTNEYVIGDARVSEGFARGYLCVCSHTNSLTVRAAPFDSIEE